MDIKKMFFGEKVPDKDDPGYKERYERDFNAGSKFARILKLDILARHVQNFANNHRVLFLVLVFAFVLISLGVNLYRMSTAVRYHYRPSSVIELQEKEMKKRLKPTLYNENIKQVESYETDGED